MQQGIDWGMEAIGVQVSRRLLALHSGGWHGPGSVAFVPRRDLNLVFTSNLEEAMRPGCGRLRPAGEAAPSTRPWDGVSLWVHQRWDRSKAAALGMQPVPGELGCYQEPTV